jgi:serine phosphatase RsbU (regulator of sigma subunit)
MPDGTPIVPEEAPSVRAMRGEKVKESRYRLTSHGGPDKVVAATASPVYADDGTVLGATTVFRDITEQVEFERQKEELFAREHHIAQMLQQAILPAEVPSEIMGYRIAVKYRPALNEAEIGGDFYDIFDLDDGRFAVVIGDVMGKGLKAAMRIASVRHAIRSYAYLDPRPSRVLTLVNDALCKDANDESRILTLFYAVVDPEIGGMTYTNAGHEPPVVCGTVGLRDALASHGLPIGVMSGFEYKQSSQRLDPGDIVAMVTDGITEARAPNHDLFGNERLIDFLAGHREGSPDEIATGIMDSATRHACGQLQDDAAVVVLAAGGNAGRGNLIPPICVT